MMRCFVGILAATVLCGVSACQTASADVAEWTVADHNHQTQTRRADRTPDMVTKDTRTAPSQRNAVVDITWAKQCANCHGKRGRGDGPQSQMVKARDLSVREWQESVSDEHLAKVIREGKDKMPAFNLPDSIVQGLVEQVRKWKRRPKGEKDDAEGDEEGGGAERAPNAPASSSTPPHGEGSPAPAAPSQKPAATPSAPAPSAPAPAPAAPAPGH